MKFSFHLIRYPVDNAMVFQRVSMNLNMTVVKLHAESPTIVSRAPIQQFLIHSDCIVDEKKHFSAKKRKF